MDSQQIKQIQEQQEKKEKEKLKNEINKLCKKMQEFLEVDNFMEACQILCLILLKKQPDWKEVSFIWTYALNQRNINYLKCILDLIQQKMTFSPQQLQQLPNQKVKEQSKQNDKKLNEVTDPNSLPQDQLKLVEEHKQKIQQATTQHLMKKYGQNTTRQQTDNPYDIVDYYNVKMHDPEIDGAEQNQFKQEKDDKDETQEIVNDPFHVSLNDILSKDSNTRNSQIIDQIKPIQEQINLDEVQIKIEPSQSAEDLNIEPQQQQEQKPQITTQQQPQTIQQQTQQPSLSQTNTTQTYQYQFQQQQLNSQQMLLQQNSIYSQVMNPLMMQMPYQQAYLMQPSIYQQQMYGQIPYLSQQQYFQIENQYNVGVQQYYVDPLSNQFNPLDANTLQQQQQSQKQQQNLPSLIEITQPEQASSTDLNQTYYEQYNNLLFQKMNDQQEQQYLKDNLNKEIVQQKFIKNLGVNKQQVKKDSEEVNQFLVEDKPEPKDPNFQYLDYTILDEMYDTLLFVGDLNFSLNVAELLYTKIKLDDNKFINQQACQYYMNKLNMLMVELIETIFQVFSKTKSRPVDYVTTINGTIEKIGDKYTEQVLLLSPNEPGNTLEYKLLKRGLLDIRENYHMIGEGEFVMLISFYLPNQDLQNDLYNMNSNQRQDLNRDMNNLANFINSLQEENEFPTQNLISSVTENGVKVEHAMIGQVKEISKDWKIKLIVLPNKIQSQAIAQQNRIWKIAKLVNRSTIDKTVEALQQFCTKITMSSYLLQILLTPPICNTKYVRMLADTKVGNLKKSNQFNNLNTSQNQALLHASQQLLTLIQGPPGTGKTTTAVEIVLEWIRQAPNSTILACADSNIAVDLLHSEFQKAGIKAIRIGPGNDERNEFMDDYQYKNYSTQIKQGNFQTAISIKYGIIKRKLQEAQVICATCVGSTSELLKNAQFNRVIIDEATQATEMSCLIPLIRNCQQLVLIGDHKQLPPTVISVFAQSKGMTISLFERLLKQGVRPQLLTIQYRMHPSICLFPSYQFYSNLLENGVGEIHRPIIYGFVWPNNLVRVAFVSIKGYEQIYSSSVQNTKEIEVVIEILIQILKQGYIKIQQIGIITPYDAQKKRIRNEINLQAKKYPQLFGLSKLDAMKINRNTVLNDVDTVDGYQGMERDLIIFSAVRCNKTGNLGFLKDPRRMNVTLTRAKRGLILVGDTETLSYDSNWKDYINWAKSNKLIVYYNKQG